MHVNPLDAGIAGIPGEIQHTYHPEWMEEIDN